MFKHKDGLNHQSNIQFVINTDDMTYQCDDGCYVSHSFAQYVDIKSGCLCQSDLGDAYPRSMVVTIAQDYDPESMSFKKTLRSNVIEFKGKIGNNYINATLKGLEVGTNNVLTCGTSAPHKMKVAGITGWNKLENVYLGVTDRNTGKSRVVWITDTSPDCNNIEYEVMLFDKINDDRFVIMYSKYMIAKNERVLYCTIVDESGNIIKTQKIKKVKGVVYNNMTPPTYDNGKIAWIEPVYKKKNYTQWFWGKKYKAYKYVHKKNYLNTVTIE